MRRPKTTLSREEEDKAMIADPRRWPRWPWLPLKRPVPGQAWPDMGVLHADDEGPYRVFSTLLPEVDTWFPTATMTVAKTYQTIDAMLVDGWKVD